MTPQVKILILLSAIFILAVSFVPFSKADTAATANYYFQTGTQTVNGETGYIISTSSGWAGTSVSTNFTGTGQVDFGFTAAVVHSITTQDDDEILGATPTAVVSRTSAGEGYQNNTVTAQAVTLVPNLNIIKVTMYMRFDGGEWLAKATFITARLLESQITSATWNFTVYTKVSIADGDTTATMYWGDQTHLSQLRNVAYMQPTPQVGALALGFGGDWVGMIVYPFTYIIGDMFYGFILLFAGGNLYLRHKKIEVLVVMFLLWGGSTGAGFLIPVVAYRIVYIIVLLALAAILYRTFR